MRMQEGTEKSLYSCAPNCDLIGAFENASDKKREVRVAPAAPMPKLLPTGPSAATAALTTGRADAQASHHTRRSLREHHLAEHSGASPRATRGRARCPQMSIMGATPVDRALRSFIEFAAARFA